MGQLAGVWVKLWSCAVPAWTLVTSRTYFGAFSVPVSGVHCPCLLLLCVFSLAPSLEREGNSRGIYKWCHEWFGVQIHPFRQNHTSSLQCPCFDWRIHSHFQDFQFSHMVCQLVLSSHQNWEELNWSCQSPYQTMVLARGIKARRVAHLNGKWPIHTVSGQCVQDSSGYFLCVIQNIICTKEVAIFILLPSWESEAGLYLAQKNIWCDFSENTIGECLIHIVVTRPQKVSHAVGLSFN